jgi:hypothetical protein
MSLGYFQICVTVRASLNHVATKAPPACFHPDWGAAKNYAKQWEAEE